MLGGLTLLSLANSFSGSITVSAGTLQASYDTPASGTATSLGNLMVAGKTITVNGGAVLQFTGQNIMGQGTAVPPTAQINILQGGLLSVTVANNSDMVGPLSLSGGTLYGAAAGTTFNVGVGTTETISVSGSATSYISGISTFSGFDLAASNTFNITGAGGLTVSIPLMNPIRTNPTASLIMTGPGTLVLAAADTYSGTTTINAGVIQLSNSNALQSTLVQDNVPGGLTFATSGLSYQVGGLSGSGAITLTATGGGGLTLNVAGGSTPTTYSGALGGLGGVTNSSGTLTLNGLNNTYGGATTVAGGMLVAANSGAINGWQTPGNVFVGAAGTLVLQAGVNANEFSSANVGLLAASSSFSTGSVLGLSVTDASPFNLSNSIGGPQGLRLLGGGVLVLGVSNSYTGPTTVSAGTLELADPAGLAVATSPLLTVSAAPAWPFPTRRPTIWADWPAPAAFPWPPSAAGTPR